MLLACLLRPKFGAGRLSVWPLPPTAHSWTLHTSFDRKIRVLEPSHERPAPWGSEIRTRRSYQNTHTHNYCKEKPKFESIRNLLCFAKRSRWGSFYSHNFNSWIKSNHICSTHYTLRPFFTVCSLCDVLWEMGIFCMQICGKTSSFFFPVQFLPGFFSPCFLSWLTFHIVFLFSAVIYILMHPAGVLYAKWETTIRLLNAHKTIQ